MRRLGPHTIDVLTPGETTDRAGDVITDWATPVEVTVAGCSVQPAPDSEYLDGRAAVGTRWTVYAPADAPITAASRVRFDGQVYEVDGAPQTWDFAPLTHMQAIIRRVEG